MEKEKIFSVTSVQLSFIKTKPMKLVVTATGQTRTSGWAQPELKMIRLVKDGVYFFDFEATPPSQPSSDVLTEVRAVYEFNSIPADLKGVQVNAESNFKVAMINDGTEVKDVGGYLFSKLGRIGSKSEGPDYFLQTFLDGPDSKDIPIRKEVQAWQRDPKLHKFLGETVLVSGKMEGGQLQVEKIGPLD